VTEVALMTEGTYPYEFGGVSVWCDQLIRTLPTYTFHVIALVATGTERPMWPVPGNVASVCAVPTWPPAPSAPRRRRRCSPQFRPILADLIGVLLDPSAAAQDRFGAVLRALVTHGRRANLTAEFTTEEAVRVLDDAWHADDPGPEGATAPTVHDALVALELFEHALRPLVHPPVRADLVHASTSGLGLLPALASTWLHGTPLIVSEHGVYLREQYLHARFGPYRWPVKALYLTFLRRLCALGYREAAVITSCNVYNRRWQERLGASPSVVRTVYNGVNPDDFPALDTEPDRPTIVWVGRIDPIKDIATLLRSFALVLREIPDARLRMYGSPPTGREDYLAYCRRLATDLGAGSAATFEGRAPVPREAYGSGHIVVLCSVSEGLPYTLIEAMTSGRACVATDVGGVGETLGETGLLVPPRDPAALARACLALLRDPARRRRLGSAARRRALELFTVEKTITTFGQIYRSLA
jgi:glycosyltransferase involved in cell wall biosynthesis